MLKMLPADTLTWPRRAAIIGAGTMGLGVAESWIAAGVAVTLVDAAPEQTRLAHGRLAERVQNHAEAGLVDPAMRRDGLVSAIVLDIETDLRHRKTEHGRAQQTLPPRRSDKHQQRVSDDEGRENGGDLQIHLRTVARPSTATLEECVDPAPQLALEGIVAAELESVRRILRARYPICACAVD